MATRTGVVHRPNETNFLKKKIMTVKARRAIDKMAYMMSDLAGLQTQGVKLSRVLDFIAPFSKVRCRY
jgi:hypothetical protein